jgi:hypothetical protein
MQTAPCRYPTKMRTMAIWCAAKAHGRNVVRPWGMQVPLEPLELSIAGHLAM